MRARHAHFIAPMLAAPIVAALDEKARGRCQRVVRRTVGRDFAVAVIVDAHIQPDFRHPLGVAHGAGPGADHFLRRAPAALNDDQSVDQLPLPIGAPARFAPGQRRQRRNDRPHMVFRHHRIAECRLDPPDAEHDGGLDAEIPLDARQQRRVLRRFLLAGGNFPVGGDAVEILPELQAEFGLIADRLKPGRVGHAVARMTRV